jgi:hypothetical protein
LLKPPPPQTKFLGTPLAVRILAVFVFPYAYEDGHFVRLRRNVLCHALVVGTPAPCNNRICVEKKNQVDVTECFVALMICSTCFGHFHAHHHPVTSSWSFFSTHMQRCTDKHTSTLARGC